MNHPTGVRGGNRPALIILNPKAGRAGRAFSGNLQRARDVLADGGVETDLVTTDTPGSATLLARQAVQEHRPLVIVCGGDGTLNEAVNGLAGSAVPLGLLPAGTANILAKELGLPWDLEAAATLLARSELRRIALGVLSTGDDPHHQRYFLSTAGAGPDGAIVKGVSNRLKARTGTLAYWAEGFRQLAQYGFPRFRATIGDRTMDATLIIVGRTRHYGGPFRITTEASLYDDQFELMLCTTANPLTYLSYLPLVWAGRLRRARHAHFLKSAGVRCEPIGPAPIYIQVDGEPAGRLPAEFRIARDALTLAVPRASNGGRDPRPE